MEHFAEPYRIKVVEPINLISREEREQRIREAHFNIFNIKSRHVFIDLLTDSGTGAMSDNQWAGMMLGDEAYAQCANYEHFESTLRDVFGFKYFIPVHQGRVAENLLFSNIVKPGDYIPNNTHFDTTRANTLHKGGYPVDFICSEARDPHSQYPFKGNMDVARLEEFIREKGAAKIPACFLTVTNNSTGGQPVSMANIRATKEVLDKFGIPLYFDAARFAENAYFIQQREAGYKDRPIIDIVREMFSYGDGVLMSAKKDGLVNMGGFIGINDAELEEKITNLMILIEGFRTYGGLAGRDLEAIARGIYEALDPRYLEFRTKQVKLLGEELMKRGVPIIEPTGGHAVFINAGEFLPSIPPSEFPGQSIVIALYREGGIRSCEIGSIMFETKDPTTGKSEYAPYELVRLAVPRRVYTNAHLMHVALCMDKIRDYKDKLVGFDIVHQSKYLRHFTLKLEEKKSVRTSV
ncbi:MAG: tryptophanase [candidate division Zixibacteria bacterium]|nr:tryptophanase [candidate division Zixibacteria bacterium]